MGQGGTYGVEAVVGQQRCLCAILSLCRVTRVVRHTCCVSRVCHVSVLRVVCPRVPTSRVAVAHVCPRVIASRVSRHHGVSRMFRVISLSRVWRVLMSYVSHTCPHAVFPHVVVPRVCCVPTSRVSPCRVAVSCVSPWGCVTRVLPPCWCVTRVSACCVSARHGIVSHVCRYVVCPRVM